MTLKENRENFRIVLGLTRKQPWLENKTLEVESLIFQDCTEQSQRELLIELLDRFIYLNKDSYIKAIQELLEDIITEPALNDETTQIVAMAADASADSSQTVLYWLKVNLQKYGWEKYKHVNRFGKAYATYRESNTHKNIVLVDEFVGSGKTVLNRVAGIKKVFADKGVADFTVKVKSIVSTNVGAELIKSSGIDFSAQIYLKKGISDYYKGTWRRDKIELMSTLENILKDKYLGRNLPRLGYGEAEALYCYSEGNTPNNVFPVFWWPAYKNGDSRKTVLTRAMGDA